MALLLKDCGLEGFKGSVQRCAECRRQTAHFHRPGGTPICGVCGCVSSATALRAPAQAHRAARAKVRGLMPLALMLR
ncbi:MAG: hypothetical protein RLZZ387_3498 [Chloroflexota bacterium]|jgi:recombinational DNA repair protein (RecF pathway)